MNLKTCQWLLEGAYAFQKDPKLQEWNGLKKESCIFLLTSIFKVETFPEAVSLLEKVVRGELTAPSLAAEEEGVAFVPVFTLLQPKVAFSFAKKVALSPIVKIIQLVDRVAGEELPNDVAKTVPEERQAVSEFREALHQGLTAKDVEASIAAFQEAGLSPDHPKLVELEKKRIRLESYEKSHRLVAGVLKHYHEYSKITGRRQIYLPEIKAYLPRLSPPPVWSRKRGYSWALRQTLTKIGTGLRFYQKIPLAPEKTIIHFSLPDTLTKIVTFGKVKTFQAVKVAVYQKAIKPILVRLGKTAIGKGIKKAGAWILTKLGLAALPEPVSKVVLVASFVWDAAKFVWKKAKPIIKKLGLVLVGAAFALAGLVVGLPLSIAFFGISALLLGTAILGPTFWAGLTAGIGVLTAQATAILTGIFTSITAPITGTVGALAVVGTILAIAGLTFYIVLTTSAAFILPIVPTPSRYLEPFPPSVIEPKCVDLVDLINDTANNHCVPPAIILAIARMEAAGFLGWSCEEVARFSTPDWWKNASETELRRGYCYDTCKNRTDCAPGANVMGPMQIEKGTWEHYMLGVDPQYRCQLDLSLIAASKYIKDVSGTGGNCGPWDEKTVRYVAYRYCGSCGTSGCQESPNPNDPCSSACGFDYCGNVWINYQQYEGR